MTVYVLGNSLEDAIGKVYAGLGDKTPEDALKESCWSSEGDVLYEIQLEGKLYEKTS